jgi:glycosyltransferase involved in cell wall biosynthesis
LGIAAFHLRREWDKDSFVFLLAGRPHLKISVITAVYNADVTVAEAITSVASQTYPDIEHIVIEGNSSDRSLAAIERAAHLRMSLFSEPDSGLYEALNKGVARATGDVIGFVHADDYLAHDEVLAHIAEAFADPALEAVYSDLDYVLRNDTSRIIRRWRSRPFEQRLLAQGWMPPHPTFYLRRQAFERLGGFDPRLQISADYDFLLRYFTGEAVSSRYLPEVTYKMRTGGISNRDLKKIRHKMAEDYLVIRRNRVGGAMTLVAKNLSKVRQFIRSA